MNRHSLQQQWHDEYVQIVPDPVLLVFYQGYSKVSARFRGSGFGFSFLGFESCKPSSRFFVAGPACSIGVETPMFEQLQLNPLSLNLPRPDLCAGTRPLKQIYSFLH